MPYKSIRYYLNTVFLKAAGWMYAVFPKPEKNIGITTGDLDFTKRKKSGNLQRVYSSYEFFRHPDNLGKFLIFQNGIAQCRTDTGHTAFNPLFPSYYGLVLFNDFLRTGSRNSLDKSKLQLRFLLKYGTESEVGFFLYYQESLPKFLLKGRWYAGITQATMLSLALRLNQLNPDEKLELVIHKLVKSMMVPGAEGGILINTPEGLPWIEEYPGAKPSYVLNGFIFCIIALLEYEIVFPKKEISDFINALLESLIHSFPQYQRGKYLKYSRLYPTLSNIEYQGLYIGQFKHLYLLTGLEIFSQLAELYNSRINWAAFNEFFQITSPALQNKPA